MSGSQQNKASRTGGGASTAPTSSLVILAAVIGTAVAFISLLWVLFGVVDRMERATRERNETLVTNGIALKMRANEHAISPLVLWDDTVEHLGNQFDRAWAQANIVSYLHQNGGFEAVFAIDANDRPILGFEGDAIVPESRYATYAQQAAPLIRRIRERERKRGDFELERPSSTMISKPIAESAIITTGSGIYILTASLVQPDFGKARPGPRAPIVIAGDAADDSFRTWVATYFLLKDVRIERSPRASGEHNRERSPLISPSDEVIGYVTWRRKNVVYDLLAASAVPLLLIFSLLLIMPMLLIRHERGRSRALEIARRQAESASEAKSEFLANMSHEIRTPLNGVLGMAQVMAHDPLSDLQRERLDVIRASGQGLLSLLNDLLDLSKIEAAKLEFEDGEFDLEGVLRLACDPFFSIAQTKELPLQIDIAEGAAGVWRGDPARVRQIVGNLVSNALKFTREGYVRIDAARTANGLRIRVSDTGVGIPAQKLGLLFSKFSQADASTTREYGGTGLGLSISRELARLMGGDITVVSAAGVGATFTVVLPLIRLRESAAEDAAALDAHAAEAAVQAAAAERPVRILAAEDNTTNQLVLRAMLDAVGADLRLVDNGAEAIKAWTQSPFDLILMDVQMPIMDGVAATRAIRSMEAANGRVRVPIIALTANSMTHQIGEYLAAGMDDHVAKPIETEVLYAALNRALAGEIRRAAAA